MKVTFVCPDWYPSISGLAITTFEFAKMLKDRGHTVKVITSDVKNLDNKGLNVIPCKNIINLIGRNPIVYGLYRLLKEDDSDVIILCSYMFEMNSRVTLYKTMRLIKKPLVLWYLGSLESYTLPLLKPLTRFSKILWDNTCGWFLLRKVNLVISNSKPTLQIMNKEYGVPFNRLSYASGFVDCNLFSKSTLNHKRILFNGRLTENKGVKFFEDILRQIPPDWKFTIIGNGPMEDFVLKLKERYHNIEYLGHVEYDHVVKVYSKTDILVLPTFAEGSPRAVLEACASGIPFVCFDVGDVPTLADGVNNGFCIKRYDIEDFVSKMLILIKDNKLREKMGSNAYFFAKKNLDLPVVYEKLLSDISNLSK